MKYLFPLLLALASSASFAGTYTPPEQAFSFFIGPNSAGGHELRVAVQPGFALYRDNLEVTGEGVSVGSVHLPDGEILDDPYVGPKRVLTGRVSIQIDARVLPDASHPTLVVTYLGCQVHEFCYPPQTLRFDMSGL